MNHSYKRPPRQPRETIQVGGATLDAVISKAALQLGVKPHEVSYEVTKESSGIVSLFTGKKIEIAAWKKDFSRSGGRSSGRFNNRRRDHRPRQQENYSSEDDSSQEFDDKTEAPREVIQLSAEEKLTLSNELKDFCQSLCQLMVQEENIEIKVHENDTRLIFDVQNEEISELFKKTPKLYESLEHLLRKKPKHIKQELPFRIFVDAMSQRVSKEGELVELAKSLSEQVAETQKPIVLNYRSAYDRRIIHLTLDKHDKVYTKSVGSGSQRKLMILPIKERSRRAAETSEQS